MGLALATSTGSLPIGGVILETSALIVGFIAGAIAIGASLGRAYAILRDWDDRDVQQVTALGGAFGFGFALMVIGLDQVAA